MYGKVLLALFLAPVCAEVALHLIKRGAFSPRLFRVANMTNFIAISASGVILLLAFAFSGVSFAHQLWLLAGIVIAPMTGVLLVVAIRHCCVPGWAVITPPGSKYAYRVRREGRRSYSIHLTTRTAKQRRRPPYTKSIENEVVLALSNAKANLPLGASILILSPRRNFARKILSCKAKLVSSFPQCRIQEAEEIFGRTTIVLLVVVARIRWLARRCRGKVASLTDFDRRSHGVVIETI